MKYPKQCVSGKPINLMEFDLGIINQPKVDVFMGDYDVNDFIKPFYIEQTLYLDEKIKVMNMPLSIYIEVARKNGMLNGLVESLNIIYETEDIKVTVVDDRYVVIIKKDNKGYAMLTDDNFHILSDMIFEILDYEKPEPESEYEGDPELIKIVKEAEAKQKMKQRKDNILTLEIMIHDIMHTRDKTYDDIKSWTVWQVKDTYKVDILREHKMDSYILASGGHYKVNLKKVKDWRKESRVLDDNLLNQ